jgi:hypothetical protein
MATRSRVTTERTEVTISDFAKEMKRLEDEGSESLNFLFYGDSNAGKTVLAGTAPGKVLWLVGENGHKSARARGARGLVRQVGNTATALAAIDYLYDNERYKRLDWIVLDGLSTMQDRFRLGYTQEAFDLRPGSRAHRNLPDKPDYFNTQNFLKAWIPQLVDMPVNLIITAHAARTDKTENGELLVFPNIQGKVSEVSNSISGLMDVTAFYQKRRLRIRGQEQSKLVRRLWFDPPEPRKGEEEISYVVGDKLGCLGAYMDSPTMPRILEKINKREEAGS